MALDKVTSSPAAVAARARQLDTQKPSTPAATAAAKARHVPVDEFSAAPRRPMLSLAAAAPAKAQKLTTIYQDKFVKIVSDEKLPLDQAKAVAKKIEDANAFDIAQEQWKDTSKLNKQLTVEVLSKAGFDKVLGGDSTGVAGVTLGANLMAVPDDLASRQNPDDDDTIAHEVSHVQDFRQGGRGLDTQVPIYVQEGKAYSLGDMYPIALHEDGKDPVLGRIAKELGGITAAQAQDVMDNYRSPDAESDPSRDGFRDETTGALYIQFLKSRLGGKGFADAIPRMAQVISDVGNGAKYDDAFKKQFGVSSKDSEKAFVQYVKDTEGKPAERLKGTIWAPYLATATAEKKVA